MTHAIPWPKRALETVPAPPFTRREWVARVATGELAGFAIPGAAWGTAWALGLPPLVTAAVVVAAGAGEGAVLGAAQASLLRRRFGGIARPWVGATAAAAALAWAMGMTPSTLADLGAPAWASIAAVAAFALPLLLSIGAGQWVVLRRRVPRAWRWIAANVAAWLTGLPVTFIAPALVPNGSPWWAFAAAFLAGGVAMAVTIATVTGVAMTRMLAEAPPTRP